MGRYGVFKVQFDSSGEITPESSTLEEFEELDGQLIATRKLIREQERLLNMMASMDVQLREARKQLSPLVTRLKYEKADVQVLESLSLEAAFFALLGRREQQLEKEVRSTWK